MTDEGLKDVVEGFGDGQVKDVILQKYGECLKHEVLFGEPLDVKEVKTATRQYDHGQASENTVVESGVRVIFDPEKTDLSSLQSGGGIRQNLRAIAEQHFTAPLEKIDVMVADDGYTVWLIPEGASIT